MAELLSTFPYEGKLDLFGTQQNFDALKKALLSFDFTSSLDIGSAVNLQTVSEEQSDSAYLAVDATVARAASPTPRFGAWLLALTSTGGDPRLRLKDANCVPVVAGRTYTLSLYARPQATVRSIRLSALALNGSFGTVEESVGVTKSEVIGDWVRITHAYTVPVGAVWLTWVARPSGAAAAEQHYFDGIKVEEGSIATGFVNSLSDITYNAGLVTAGTFRGTVFETAEANPKVRFDSTGMFLTDSGGDKVVNLDTAGLRLRPAATGSEGGKSVSFQSASGLRPLGALYGSDSIDLAGINSTSIYAQVESSLSNPLRGELRCTTRNSATVKAMATTAAGALHERTIINGLRQSHFPTRYSGGSTNAADIRFNLGTATLPSNGDPSPSTYGSMAHGLGVTPDVVLVSPRSSDRLVVSWESSITDSTNFGVTARRNDDASFGSNAQISWLALDIG